MFTISITTFTAKNESSVDNQEVNASQIEALASGFEFIKSESGVAVLSNRKDKEIRLVSGSPTDYMAVIQPIIDAEFE